MPIYLVRWPDLSASLVRAEDEEHLLDVLDQTDNPEGCEWEVYDGPLAVDFRLPGRWGVREARAGEPVEPDQVVVEDVGPMAREHVVETMQVSLAGGGDGHETGEAILRRAFPLLQAALEEFRASDGAQEQDFIPPEADLRKALQAELARMLTASRGLAHVERTADPISRLVREMDLPVGLARRYAEIAVAKRHGDDDELMSETDPKAPAGGRLFEVSNHHSVSCGKGPLIDGDDPGKHFSYFVNEHGEQAVYCYDYETGEATARMGDGGWQTAHPVVNGEMDGLLLTKPELLWLRACWMATGGAWEAGREKARRGSNVENLMWSKFGRLLA